MRLPRQTLRAPVNLDGRGLHSGAPVAVTIHPYSAGIAFRHAAEQVEAVPENVTDTSRCTALGGISTVEHLMSALAGLEVTDAMIELTAPELPGLDGSSAPYVEAIMDAGLEKLEDRQVPELFSRVFFVEDEIKIAVSKGSGHWRYELCFAERWPGVQAFETPDVISAYRDEIARSRTIALAEEIPGIVGAGLGRGLDESSVLILGIEGYKNEPRFPDEPARHKLLDLMGDLYLAGLPLRMLNVVAERSGHRTNVETARRLRLACQWPD